MRFYSVPKRSYANEYGWNNNVWIIMLSNAKTFDEPYVSNILNV